MKNVEVHKKIEELDEKVDSLNVRIEKRPTFVGIIGIALAGLSIISGLTFFILDNLLSAQSGRIFAETKLIISETMSDYTERDKAKWAKREKSVINTILVKLGLK
jgi:hypothetical protein